jgi:hypothetical protein
MAKLTTAKITARATSKSSKALLQPVYNIFVMENTKTSGPYAGGRYVSVRKNLSIKAFWRIMCAGARDYNFDQPIHYSMRKDGDNAHSVRLIGTYTSKTEAQVIAAKMIESNARKDRALNAARPKAGAAPKTEFVWEPEAETTARLRAERKAKTVTSKQPETAEASA